MMKRNEIKGFTLPLALLAGLLPQCDTGIAGSGKKDTVTRYVSQFNTIVSEGDLDFTVNLTEQTSPTSIDREMVDSNSEEGVPEDSIEISIEGDDNLIPLLITEVRNTKLFIEPKELLDPALQIRITVHSGELDRFIHKGDGDHTITGIDSGEFSLVIEGEGDHTLRGVTDEVIIDIAGSGNVNAFHLESNYAFINVEGSGDVDLCVYEVLNVDLTGSGDITYDCSPYSVTYDIAGSGTVEPR